MLTANYNKETRKLTITLTLFDEIGVYATNTHAGNTLQLLTAVFMRRVTGYIGSPELVAAWMREKDLSKLVECLNRAINDKFTVKVINKDNSEESFTIENRGRLPAALGTGENLDMILVRRRTQYDDLQLSINNNVADDFFHEIFYVDNRDNVVISEVTYFDGALGDTVYLNLLECFANKFFSGDTLHADNNKS